MNKLIKECMNQLVISEEECLLWKVFCNSIQKCQERKAEMLENRVKIFWNVLQKPLFIFYTNFENNSKNFNWTLEEKYKKPSGKVVQSLVKEESGTVRGGISPATPDQVLRSL